MPTVKELRDFAEELGLKPKSSLKKADLIALIGKEKMEEIELATDLIDVQFKKSLKHEGDVYKKLWDKKEPKLYLAVLKSDDNHAVLIKGQLSQGLGKGGGKWRYDMVIL